MVLSMTGYGEAQHQDESLEIAVEVRTINSRYFKLAMRATEGYNSLESQVEAEIRKHIKRGTVQVGIRVQRQSTSDGCRVNEAVLRGYYDQLVKFQGQLNDAGPVRLESLLLLPGVVEEDSAGSGSAAADWPLICDTLQSAMQRLAAMRAEEGRAMGTDLRSNCTTIAEQLAHVEKRAPRVVDNYRQRITDRLQKLLSEYEVTVEASDIVREVGMFAERTDISEEIVRLKSHLDQFDTIMGEEDVSGRKLEFLTQEMFREANTIGSKANDAEIALHVIEIKASIERMREMIQNIE